MAAGIVAARTNAIFTKLDKMRFDEDSLAMCFRKEFEWLEKKLARISGHLYGAEDEDSKQSDDVKEWLQEVGDICHDTEDIMDLCALVPTTQSCLGSDRFVRRFAMGKRVKDLKQRVMSAIQKGSQLSDSWSTRGRDYSSKRRSEIWESNLPSVGIKDKVEDILSLLEDPSVTVLALTGMGGIGKTFLMRHVYDRAYERYEKCAWITLNQFYSMKRLQCHLGSQIGLAIDEGISEVRGSEVIHGYLDGKCCLIVLDDMWTTNSENSVINNLISRFGLPGGRHSTCKIVVTTRSRILFPTMNVHKYEMELLSAEDSWKLFCIHAFPKSEGNRPPKYLESVARSVERECGRLPLAVKMVASSMANYSLEEEWESKLKELLISKEPILQILKPSYDSLPQHLKICFAYFCFFPKDYIIPCEYLIHLWLAEGLLTPSYPGEDEMDVGVSYLLQLANLSLVDVTGQSLDASLSCSVHELMMDLAIYISMENRCEFTPPSLLKSCRRILLAQQGMDTDAISQSSLRNQKFLRTLSLSENSKIRNIPENLFDRLRVLRVLDFGYTQISTLPKSVGNMQLLKILNLSGTKINEVPECVRRLKYLQFLDLTLCANLQRLPDWIGELKCLSYLSVILCSETLDCMPKGILKLLNLKTLRSAWLKLDFEENEWLNLKDVSNMISLQELRISINDKLCFNRVEDGILARLVKMRHFGLWNNVPQKELDKELIFPPFPATMKSFKDLETLHLCRFSVPSWLCLSGNLRELVLTYCSSDYPALQTIPNLEVLSLIGNQTCTKLPKHFGESRGFSRLVQLSVQGFPLLEEFPALEDRAMQRLKILKIWDCPRVKKVPDGLEKLKTLKTIECSGSYGGVNELMERLQEGGEDWNSIKAYNPRVTISLLNRLKNGSTVAMLL
ncbi:putative disease resistance protein At1g58400 [Cryptomeria japonica]|uniref:putative disease resistance protein At1g58400 n=1 Tax=Cryptomeria japonica TaxID=3369 RepID=UPI0025AC17A6|nr:putative disease resistance protein At1g58400 [Cryptomeria japonica]